MEAKITDLRNPFLNGWECAWFVTNWKSENNWFEVSNRTFFDLKSHFINEFKSIVITPNGVLIS